MWGRLVLFILAATATVSPVGARAMSDQEIQHPCRVIGGDKLPPAVGGARALCQTVERAVAERAPKVRYTAEITVISRSRLAATLVVNGRTLPEQKFAVMDRDLNPGSIKRFAATLALEVLSKAGRA